MTTAERQDCAHVCTTQLIHASGYIDPLNGLDNTRRFWPVDQQQIDDTPPVNWVGHLIPAAKRYDATATEHDLNKFSDDYFWRTTFYDPHWQLGHRHAGVKRDAPHCWIVHLRQQIGRITWSTEVHAATDDFGWLVEVPAC